MPETYDELIGLVDGTNLSDRPRRIGTFVPEQMHVLFVYKAQNGFAQTDFLGSFIDSNDILAEKAKIEQAENITVKEMFIYTYDAGADTFVTRMYWSDDNPANFMIVDL